MPGTIKLTIERNAAVKSDMKGFKSCAKRTEELLEQMQVEADDVSYREREEEVQSVSTQNQKQRVRVK